MLRILWKLTRGYRLRPWKSPYLRWRIETYSGIHAGEITFGEFWGFCWKQRRELLRYLKWAARMSGAPAPRRISRSGLKRTESSAVGSKRQHREKRRRDQAAGRRFADRDGFATRLELCRDPFRLGHQIL